MTGYPFSRRSLHRAARAAGAAVLFVIAPGPRGVGAQTGTITGQVISKVEGTPIGYAVIGIPALQREQFTGPDGRFTLTNVPVGRVTLRARHIGHIPHDVTVDVAAGAAASVKIDLERAPIVLPVVTAAPACVNPGVPSAADAPELAALVGLLRENAERYRLLVKQYPFRYVVQRRYLKRWASDGKVRELKVDTAAFATYTGYVYSPGTVMQRSASGQPYFLFAQLDDWAGEPFLGSHCFHYGGEAEFDGEKLLEIDFAASEKIETPDMDGAMFLDPRTYQIRRTTVSLSRLPKELKESGGVVVTSVFTDILPSIPVMGQVDAETRLKLNPVNSAWEANIEEHRLIQVQFLRGRPQ